MSNIIDLKNPDKVFKERADEKSKKLWAKLKKIGQVRCETAKKKE